MGARLAGAVSELGVRRATLILLTVTGVACGTPSATPAPPVEGSPAGTGRAATDECAPSDLRMPSGTRVDLTGTWEGAGARLFVHQYGECVWIEEFSADGREGLGDSYRRVFFGRLGADFMIVGRFADIYSRDAPPLFGFVIPPEGDTSFRVIVREESGAEVVVLEGRRRESTDAGFFPTEYTRIAPGTELPP